MAAKDRSTKPRLDQPIGEKEMDKMFSDQVREGIKRDKPTTSFSNVMHEKFKMEMEKGGMIPHV